MQRRSNHLDSCGSSSSFCIASLKRCLKDHGADGTQKPSYGKSNDSIRGLLGCVYTWQTLSVTVCFSCRVTPGYLASSKLAG